MCGCGDKGLWRISALALWTIAAPAWAHVVSMSTGELRIDGPLADYELRIPMVEVAQMANPQSILEYIRFDGGHRTSAKCADEDGTYVCRASYEFATLVPERLGVECTFFEATVANHVHWLHAVRGANSDQEIFDQAFPRSELRFRPPSAIETFGREFGLGFARAAKNWIGLLFLLGLAIAAPRRMLPFGCFLMGEAGAILIGPLIPWPLGPRFLEAAMALTVAYLAVEILMAADAKNLAWIVGVLGLFHGLGISGFPAPYSVATGVWQIAVFAGLAWGARRVSILWRRTIAWGLLVAGLGGFLMKVIVR
jgi:hypothetical protein